MGAGGGLREGALVWYESCLGISFRAHCWQACARFLLGGTLARSLSWGLGYGEILARDFRR